MAILPGPIGRLRPQIVKSYWERYSYKLTSYGASSSENGRATDSNQMSRIDSAYGGRSSIGLTYVVVSLPATLKRGSARRLLHPADGRQRRGEGQASSEERDSDGSETAHGSTDSTCLG